MKLCLMCALVVALLASAVAEDFQNHSISFEIPDGWDIYSDIEVGDNSSTILTDGKGAIRIDTIHLTDESLTEIVGDYYRSTSDGCYQLNPDASWQEIYGRDSWRVVNAFREYYRGQVVPPTIQGGGARWGAGSDDFLALGEYISYSTNGPQGQQPYEPLLEWYLVWIRPEYNGSFVAVHGLFPVNRYEAVKVAGFGRDGNHHWPTPLYNIMISFSTDWSGKLCKDGLRTGDEALLSLV